VPKQTEFIVQECAQGLIRIRCDRGKKTDIGTLSFRAPPLTRSGPLEDEELASIIAALGLSPLDVLAHSWCVNGPNWRGLLLKSSEQVLRVTPNQTLLGDKDVGIIGPRLDIGEDSDASLQQSDFDFEVRAFCPLDNPFEDPATGSLNAGLAQWLIRDGLAPSGGYVVRQGTAVGRKAKINITVEKGGEGDVWVGGVCTTCISGVASFDSP
jgi:PhzF family phenazine biosynthesis protein